MSAFRSSLAAALLGLAGCYAEIPTHPFHLSATVVATGADAKASPTELTQLVGMAQLEGPASLLVDDATYGQVRVSFDGAAAPGVSIPTIFDGAQVSVALQWTDRAVDPKGDPMPLVTVRIGFGVQGAVATPRFIIAEGSVRTGNGVAAVPEVAQPFLGQTDLPLYDVISTGLAFVVTHCGEVYPDQLSAAGPDRTLYLSEGQEGIIPVGTLGAPTWVVHHVKSWHRAGREGSCREPGAWTQLAAWR